MNRGNLIALLLLALLCLARPAEAQVPDQINLFIPAFEGPGALGQNVATVLNLRVWSTLRSKPWPDNPDNLDFGRGLIIWDPRSLAGQSHADAEQAAMAFGILAQMTLWGKAYPYGDDVVVQANLSIPDYHDFRDYDTEIWTITYRGQTVSADIPRRRFEVSSIVLDRDVVDDYSLPASLDIYEQRRGGQSIGTVGNAYRAIQFEPDLALVIANRQRGWVRLPQLSKQPTEVSAFVGGVVRIFRGDWKGAVKQMARVLENPNTRTPLRIDALLYTGMALERMGRSGREHFQQALEINPYAQRTVRYLLMSDLAALARMGDNSEFTGQVDALTQRLKDAVVEHARLFAVEDQWLAEVRAALQ